MATYNTNAAFYGKPKAKATAGDNEKIIIFPYNRKSKSYKNLAAGLRLKFPRVQDVEFAHINDQNKRFPVLINWGSGNLPGWAVNISGRVINTAPAVNICRNKLKFFNAVNGKARIPEFTDDLSVAMDWVQEGRTVMGRKANGSCGLDIKFYEDDPDLFHGSELWVQYKKKKHEFRVHVFNGGILDIQQKAIRTSDEQGQAIPSGTIDFRIRNHRNGFIFKRHDITVPEDVKTQALNAVNAIQGLTFGAVDVIYNQYEDKAYVLEVNTAPGLEGTTLENYLKAFSTL